MVFKKSYSQSEATQKLERYCAYQERCHKEVIQKLQDMRVPPETLDRIVVHLIKANFLNEERFSQNFARGKFNIKNWGRHRIIAELRQRGISKYNIQTALQEINEETYQKKFHALAEKKWDILKEKDIQKRKRKVADYLIYRGWESEQVYDKINELAKNSGS
jgi:regulatory protein